MNLLIQGQLLDFPMGFLKEATGLSEKVERSSASSGKEVKGP